MYFVRKQGRCALIEIFALYLKSLLRLRFSAKKNTNGHLIDKN